MTWFGVRRPTISERIHMTILLRTLAILMLAAGRSPAAERLPRPNAGQTITIRFPDMPPTFCAMHQKRDIKAQMSIFFPRNYEADRKFALLILLNGGDGGAGTDPGIARALSEEKDFICVSMPL